MNPKVIVKENFIKLELLTNKFTICILYKLVEIRVYRHPVDAIILIFIYLMNLYLHILLYILKCNIIYNWQH
jgi:hypothetical protein